jgi:hypothetical protein
MAHDRSRSSGSVSSGSETPRLAAIDSLTPLILTPDEQNQSPSPFQFPDDEEAAHELEQDDEEHSQTLRKAAVPLSPSTVSLYLLSPYTKLGALLLPHLRLPLKHAIPSLFGFALLSLIARYLWCMLARYLRKYNFEDVVSHTFAGGRGRERERDLLRIAIRSGTAALRAILAAVYLRCAHHRNVSCVPLYLTRFKSLYKPPRAISTRKGPGCTNLYCPEHLRRPLHTSPVAISDSCVKTRCTRHMAVNTGICRLARLYKLCVRDGQLGSGRGLC